jgi:hypothetical protein
VTPFQAGQRELNQRKDAKVQRRYDSENGSTRKLEIVLCAWFVGPDAVSPLLGGLVVGFSRVVPAEHPVHPFKPSGGSALGSSGARRLPGARPWPVSRVWASRPNPAWRPKSRPRFLQPCTRPSRGPHRRLTGHKEVLGMWVAGTEGAKFWLHVLTELKNRGVRDIFIGCVDGLKGFPEALEAVFPMTQVQLCLVRRSSPASIRAVAARANS